MSPMLVEFQTITVNQEKERLDKEKCLSLNTPYDPSEEDSYLSRYMCDISGPIRIIAETKESYKGVMYEGITLETDHIKTPFLLISYDEFINLYGTINKDLKYYKVEKKLLDDINFK